MASPNGGWAGPHADPDGEEAIVAAHSKAFDLLLAAEPTISGAAFGRQPRRVRGGNVATHKPKSLAWGPAEDLGEDIVEGVRLIREKSGPQLIVWGSSTLTPMLLEHGLADEVLLLVFPVLLSTGGQENK